MFDINTNYRRFCLQTIVELISIVLRARLSGTRVWKAAAPNDLVTVERVT